MLSSLRQLSAALVVLTLLQPVPLHAQDTSAGTAAQEALREYDSNVSGWAPAWVRAFSDVHSGFVTANSLLVTLRHEQPMFCEPANVQVTGDGLIETLRASVARHPGFALFQWQYALLEALSERYPCS